MGDRGRPNREKGTFVVRVQYRQDATWQGEVLWAERNKTQRFQSVLELVKLIDYALDQEKERSKG